MIPQQPHNGASLKRQAGRVLRLVVALAGVSFIVLTLTWRDHVVLPAGSELAGGTAIEAPTPFPVVERTPGSLIIDTSGTGDDSQHAVRRDALGRSAGSPRLQPGVLTTLRRMDWPVAVVGLVVMAVVFPLQTWRWLLLMRCRRMAVGFMRAFRLTMAGLFFNFCMPGTTGGDVVKAYYTAKNSGQTTTAVISVLLDRVVGMIGLVLLAATVGLMLWHEPWVWRITLGLWGGLAVLAIAATGYLWPGWRRVLGLDRLQGRLPGGELLARLDRAARAYRHHKATVAGTIAISLVVHACLMTSAALVGKALGVGHSFWLLIAVLPLVLLAGSVPITFQGLGVMEWLTLALLLDPGEPELATANQLVGMLLLFRLCMLAYALLGSLVLLRGDIHLFPEKSDAGEVEAASTAGVTQGAYPKSCQ